VLLMRRRMTFLRLEAIGNPAADEGEAAAGLSHNRVASSEKGAKGVAKC